MPYVDRQFSILLYSDFSKTVSNNSLYDLFFLSFSLSHCTFYSFHAILIITNLTSDIFVNNPNGNFPVMNYWTSDLLFTKSITTIFLSPFPSLAFGAGKDGMKEEQKAFKSKTTMYVKTLRHKGSDPKN